MKIIIDIDDEMVCNDIKNKALEPTSATDKVIINALYNGTPISTEGDLISREALRESFSGYTLFTANTVIENIDNAPTVELTEEQAIDKLHETGWLIRHDKEMTERPQGEWNYIQADMCVCPFCGAMPHKLYKNYCAKCGAELKGGKNEIR